MSRTPKDPNRCDCITKANAQLESKGVAVSVGFTLSGYVFPLLQTESLKTQRPTSKFRVSCAFCPFCGIELRPNVSAEVGRGVRPKRVTREKRPQARAKR